MDDGDRNDANLKTNGFTISAIEKDPRRIVVRRAGVAAAVKEVDTKEEYAKAIEVAFRQGYSYGFVNASGRNGDVESAWWDSDARAALQQGERHDD